MSQESMNPNVPTPEVTGPMEVGAGDAITFDDLSKIQSSAKPPATKPLAKEKEIKEPKDQAKEPKAKDKDLKDLPEKDLKQKEETKEVDQPVKSYKIKTGDRDVEIASDALVPVKINGKTEMVKLREVLSGYSGQSHLDRTYSAYKQERQTFDKERTEFKEQVTRVNQLVQDFHDRLVTQKDARGAIEMLAEAMGADPKQIWEETLGSVEKNVSEWSTLSEEQRQAKKLEDELSYYKRREEQARAQTQKEQSAKALEKETLGIMESYGMDKATFVKRYDELTKLGKSPEELTPKLIGEYHKNVTTVETVQEFVEAHLPTVENKNEEIERIATLAIQTGANRAEIETVIKALAASNSAEQRLSKKISKMEKKGVSEVPRKNPSTDPIFFEDLA